MKHREIRIRQKKKRGITGESYYIGENYCLTPEECKPTHGVNHTWVDLYGLFLRRSYDE